MKERPILFNGEMIRAALDGRKTNTRRVVKIQPKREYHGAQWVFDGDKWVYPNVCPEIMIQCPYGKPGDKLWVRETWGLYDTEPKDGPENATVFYRATDGGRYDLRYQKWRPSIFMPRWASRITLEMVDVRIERLQDMSEGDVYKEGCIVCPKTDMRPFVVFETLWDSINVKRGFGWDKNPWVWVVSFKAGQR